MTLRYQQNTLKFRQNIVNCKTDKVKDKYLIAKNGKKCIYLAEYQLFQLPDEGLVFSEDYV